jgi:hypothetical protein
VQASNYRFELLLKLQVPVTHTQCCKVASAAVHIYVIAPLRTYAGTICRRVSCCYSLLYSFCAASCHTNRYVRSCIALLSAVTPSWPHQYEAGDARAYSTAE